MAWLIPLALVASGTLLTISLLLRERRKKLLERHFDAVFMQRLTSRERLTRSPIKVLSDAEFLWDEKRKQVSMRVQAKYRLRISHLFTEASFKLDEARELYERHPLFLSRRRAHNAEARIRNAERLTHEAEELLEEYFQLYPSARTE